MEKLVEIIDSTRTFIQQALDAITKAKELEEPLHIDKLGEMEALLKEWDEKGLSERLDVEKKGYIPSRSPFYVVDLRGVGNRGVLEKLQRTFRKARLEGQDVNLTEDIVWSNPGALGVSIP